MQNNQNRASAKDFFLHLGAIVALYTITISFLNLIFKIINKAFPVVGGNYYGWASGSEISLPVATLIVVFPIFVSLTWMVHKTYEADESKKQLDIRKWLTYITLFAAGVLLVGDLVTVLYKFLDGQDLTAAFLLKALAVLLVAGCIFGFYLQDIRDRISPRRRKMWAGGVGVIILASIILGFGILGSPKTQRLIRMDNQRVSNLQELQWQVISHWQMYGVVPDSLPNPYLTDPETKQPYEYRKTGEMAFEICAGFDKDSTESQNGGIYAYPGAVYPNKGSMVGNDDWTHPAGRKCFQRVIDPIAYPTQIRG